MPEPRHHKHRSKQDYVTPDDFLRAVRRLLGIRAFAFDFAASIANTKAPRYWTKEIDSLKQSPRRWARMCGDGWGWLNPEFGDLKPWVHACALAKCEGARIANLLPAGVGSNWFKFFVHGDARVLFLNGRLTFAGQVQPYPKDCLLVLWAPEIADGYDVWEWRDRQATEALAATLWPDTRGAQALHDRIRKPTGGRVLRAASATA